MIFFIQTLTLIVIFLLTVSAQFFGGGSNCNTPNGYLGSCINIIECGSLYTLLLKTSITDSEKQYLRDSACGRFNRQQLVCCPPQFSQNKPDLLPDTNVCGKGGDDRIIGGNLTNILDFPWMALIEYSKPNIRSGFHCGGALINENYILTAAHCVNGLGVTQLNWRVSSVRLGEWDLSADVDCDLGDCTDNPLNIKIAEAIPHENYVPTSRNQEYDIALLRLARPVTYTDFIQPICLPKTFSVRDRNLVGISMQTAGWGKTESGRTSTIKLKVKLDGVSIDQCNESYNQRNIVVGETQICAGGKKGFDSCLGDSGGPLMVWDKSDRSRPSWYGVGIVSFGRTPCGEENWPGVYTRISSHMDWIVENIRP